MLFTLNFLKYCFSISFLFIISLIKSIILFLILTITIATVTLMERKLLSLIQRRVGPNYIGYRGRLQFIADALKLIFKQIIIINKVNKLLFIVVPALTLIVSYLFWINIVWGLNLAICEIEHNLFIMGIISTFFLIY